MSLRKIQAAEQKWKKKNSEVQSKAVKRFTSSEIEIAELYGPNKHNFSAEYFLDQIGFPGEYPFTRGVQADMYRGRLWTMRQYSGFGTAEETNKRYHYLLSQGISGLSVAFDLPTQMGRDSDHQLAAGEVGRVGVAIDSLEDIDQLFKGIDLSKISTSMTINSTAHILLALYLALAKKRNIDWSKLRGTVQNDVLKEYIARGTYVYPPKAALKIATDIFEFCKDYVPEWYTISISGYHIREAGSSAVEEVAFTLANGIAYVQAALDRGLKIDSFAQRLAFFFNCHNNFLEEVAKFRAARRMWAKIMKERFSAKNERSLQLRFHTQTAGSSLTAQQPLVNSVRTTLQALSAVFGGTQSLHTNSYDEALCLPTEESAKLALRTQQVIAYESGVADFVDPFAGSYVIENLTDQIEEKSCELIKKIDSLGGMIKAIEQDFPQKIIEESAFKYQQLIDRGEQKIVGVNAFKEEADTKINLLKINPALEEQQKKNLAQLKARREMRNVEASLKNLRKVASLNQNIVPAVIAAVENSVTLGEISDTLREVFGEY